MRIGVSKLTCVYAAALQRKRQEIAQGLIDILNESLHSYCVRGKRRQNSDQTFILGALFYALCDPSAGIIIAPMLDPALHTGPPSPFRLQWQPQMSEQSINSLLGTFAVITKAFNVELQVHRRDLSLYWQNPVPPLVAKAVTLRESLRGLRLKDYRPAVAEVMRVKACNVARKPERELQQLRNYSAPMNDDLKWTWCMMFYYLAYFQLGLTLLEIFVEGRWLRPVFLFVLSLTVYYFYLFLMMVKQRLAGFPGRKG
ncbi:hypothetical protein BGX38DRAFT_1240190 [Terfezia claveryi]|nr:hypothetical protein BGX38DRAFT_1240190 [Terfezia claveryi]